MDNISVTLISELLDKALETRSGKTSGVRGKTICPAPPQGERKSY